MADLMLNCPCCGGKIEPLEYQNEGGRIYIDGEKVVTKCRWIPCSERLPEQTGYYLVCDSTAEFDNIRGRQEVAKFVIGRHGGHWYGAIRRECITHWMPLPEPPKE